MFEVILWKLSAKHFLNKWAQTTSVTIIPAPCYIINNNQLTWMSSCLLTVGKEEMKWPASHFRSSKFYITAGCSNSHPVLATSPLHWAFPELFLELDGQTDEGVFVRRLPYSAFLHLIKYTISLPSSLLCSRLSACIRVSCFLFLTRCDNAV